jgi:hypothetical protein
LNRTNRVSGVRLASTVAAIAAVVALSGLPLAPSALAAGETISITPATMPASGAVGLNNTFTVTVAGNSGTSPVSGISASVAFDKTVLELQSAAYAATGWGTAAIKPVDLSLAATITAANTAGELDNVAGGDLSSSVRAGDQAFFSVTFKVIACPADSGTTPLTLLTSGSFPSIFQDGATTITPAVAGATVTPCGAGATASPATSSSPAASDAPTASPTAAQVPQPNTLKVTPASKTTAVGATFTLVVDQHTVASTTGSQATINFDKTLLKVVSIAKGSDFTSALLVGANADAITSANASGSLANVGASLIVGSIAAGNASFLDVTFKVLACSAEPTNIDLPVFSGTGAAVNSLMVDGATTILVSTTGASISIPCGATPAPPPPTDTVGDAAGSTADGPWLLLIACIATLVIGAFLLPRSDRSQH